MPMVPEVLIGLMERIGMRSRMKTGLRVMHLNNEKEYQNFSRLWNGDAFAASDGIFAGRRNFP